MKRRDVLAGGLTALALPRIAFAQDAIPEHNRASLTEAPPPDGSYCKKLTQQLLDPTTTVTAALRLEALGAASIPTLKVGLHSDVPLVRFAAAEALAYLGSPSCGEELGRQVAAADPREGRGHLDELLVGGFPQLASLGAAAPPDRHRDAGGEHPEGGRGQLGRQRAGVTS